LTLRWVVVALFLFVLLMPLAPASTSGPQQFNPAGAEKFTVDPYTGAVVRASSDFTYYPLASALDAAHHRLYLMELAGLIIIVDTQTNRSLPQIDLGPGETTNMVLDAQNGLLYVASNLESSGRVLAVNTTNDRVVANFSTVTEPDAMALDASNGRLFVGSEGEYGIDVYDTSDNSLLKFIPAAESSFSNAVFDQSDGYVYFPDGNQGGVLVVDGSSLNVVGTIPTKYTPYQALYDPVNSRVYVATFNFGTPANPHTRILGYETAANNVVANITMAPYFTTMFADTVTGFLYFVGVNLPNYNISSIDPTTNKIVHSMNTTEAVTLASYDQQQHVAYLTTEGEYVQEFEPSTFTFAGTVPLFAVPYALSYDAHDGAMYVASTLPGTNTTWVSLLVGPKLVGSVPLGGTPTSGSRLLAVSSKTGLAYLSFDNDTVFVVNGTSSELVGRVQARFLPLSMLYDQKDDRLFLLGGEGNFPNMEAVDLSNGSQTTASVNILPGVLAYDDVHDLLIAEDAGSGIDLVNPLTFTIVKNIPLSFNGSPVTPTGIVYDSGDNLLYAGWRELSAPYSPVLLALNESSTEELYYSYTASDQGLAYDSYNGYVYALSGGATPLLASADFPLGINVVPTAGQFVACMSLDPVDDYLYLGSRVPGVVAIDQTGLPFPGSLVVQTGASTTTETVTVSYVSTVTSTEATTFTVTSGQTSTVTTAANSPASPTVLDLALVGVIVVLALTLGYSLLSLRRRQK